MAKKMLTKSTEFHQTNLFGTDLLIQLDPNDPLLQLSSVISWKGFDDAFAKHDSKDIGAPSKPIRLMVGLLILKHLENVSDEVVVLQWKRNAYYQAFCGMTAIPTNTAVSFNGLGSFSKTYWSGRC